MVPARVPFAVSHPQLSQKTGLDSFDISGLHSQHKMNIPRESRDEYDIRHLKNEIAARKFKPGEYIEMKCFNREDVDRISSRLTSDERDRVKFTWIEFGEPGLPGVHLGLA